MAALQEMKHGDSVEIYVALPDLEPKECPLFTFMGNEWIFRFIQEKENNAMYYSAYIFMNDEKSFLQFKPFKFSYRVEMADGTKVTKLYDETYVNLRNKTYRFLRMLDSMLHNKIPYNYDGRNIIRISFTVFQPSDPVMKFKLKPRDKYPQQVSYLNADAFIGSLSQDLSELLDSGLNHDVKVRCGEHTVHAHKLILSARSKVFKTMLEQNFLEGRIGKIEIPDMDSSSFLDFIKYIYTDILPELSFEKAITLYETGDKYDVRSLSMRCSDYLQDNLSPENVYRCLVLADAHSDEKLKNEAIGYILRNKLDLQEEHWLSFCKNYPKIAFEVYKLTRENVT